MRVTVEDWLGHEFVSISGEGSERLSAGEQTADLVARFDSALRGFGLSLDNTVRTRLWARDRASRDEGSKERVRLLAGGARSVSSSYIYAGHFDSEASVGLELLAMRPSRGGVSKELVEYDPPIVPLRYLVYDSVVFLSGVTSEIGTLEEQVGVILPRIGESLSDAGVSWDRVGRIACYMHTSESIDELKSLLARTIPASVPRQVGFSEGYSTPGKLVEIEVTANRA